MSIKEEWYDGICKICGSDVIETGSTESDQDYMNRCTNSECKEHKWHHCGDMEELDYYEHDYRGKTKI
jgi:hypothetical protein